VSFTRLRLDVVLAVPVEVDGEGAKRPRPADESIHKLSNRVDFSHVLEGSSKPYPIIHSFT